jgi:hypothetical protein
MTAVVWMDLAIIYEHCIIFQCLCWPPNMLCEHSQSLRSASLWLLDIREQLLVPSDAERAASRQPAAC